MASHAASSLPDDVRRGLDAFRMIIQALRTSSRNVERRAGLTTAQLFALQQIASAPGASINELAARTFTHQSSVSVVVRRLAGLRLVRKVSATDDRRRARLQLTEAGRAILRRSPEPVQERLIAAVAALPRRKRHDFVFALTDVARRMGAHTRRPPMLFEDVERKRTRSRRR